jgi:integrase/recombinase XerC
MDKMTNITVDQAKTMFLASIAFPRSANTLQTYSKALETFSNMLVAQQTDPFNFPISELTEKSIVHFVAYMRKFSPATESLYLQVIKNFFEFLTAENLVTINLAHVRMLMRQRTRRANQDTAQYPEDDIRHLLDVVGNLQNISTLANGNELENLELRDTRDRALIIVLADTGLRVEEVCRLRCRDMDWDTKRATLKGRGNKQEFVRFSTRAINAVRDYLSLREPLDLETGRTLSSLTLFARHDKGAGKNIKPLTPTTIRRIVAERVQQVLGPEATCTITPHTFLHYFVTTILRATGNLKLAQVLARHTSIQTTQRYAHINDDELDKGYYDIFEKRDIPTKRE